MPLQCVFIGIESGDQVFRPAEDYQLFAHKMSFQ